MIYIWRPISVHAASSSNTALIELSGTFSSAWCFLINFTYEKYSLKISSFSESLQGDSIFSRTNSSARKSKFELESNPKAVAPIRTRLKMAADLIKNFILSEVCLEKLNFPDANDAEAHRGDAT